MNSSETAGTATEQTNRASDWPARARLEPALAGLLAFALYAPTCARDILWGDPAKLTLYVRSLNISLDQGAHAGAVLWAWPFSLLPLEPYAFRITLASVTAGAITVGFLHAILLRSVNDRWAARTATAAFAVSHTFWLVSTMAESYAPALLAITLGIWCLTSLNRPVLAGVILGAGTYVHILCLFSVPAIAVYILGSNGKRNRKDAGLFLAILTLALATIFLLMAPIVHQDSAGDNAFRWGNDFAHFTGTPLAVKNAPLLAGYYLYNFASPALLLIAVGLKTLDRRGIRIAAAVAATHFGFALSYLPQRAYLIPLPAYLASGFLVARGAETVLKSRQRLQPFLLAGVIAFPAVTYLTAPIVLRSTGLPSIVRHAPMRDELNYFLRPWKFSESSARRYIEAVGTATPDGSTVIGDFTLLMPLLYANSAERFQPRTRWITVGGENPETLINSIEQSLNGGRRVFLLDSQPYYFTGELLKRWELVPAGVEALTEVVTSRTVPQSTAPADP